MYPTCASLKCHRPRVPAAATWKPCRESSTANRQASGVNAQRRKRYSTAKRITAHLVRLGAKVNFGVGGRCVSRCGAAVAAVLTVGVSTSTSLFCGSRKGSLPHRSLAHVPQLMYHSRSTCDSTAALLLYTLDHTLYSLRQHDSTLLSQHCTRCDVAPTAVLACMLYTW